jgi:uncharacterized protein (DUF1330 family)/ketosteroid isomerase-like protein
MVAYVAAQLQIHDPARYQTYADRFVSTLTGVGGRLLVADDRPDVLDGDWPYDKFVLLQFASAQAATAWSGSDAYRRIAGDREAAATTTALLLKGAPTVPDVGPVAGSRDVGDLHPNVLTYVKAIEAFNRDDPDAVRAYVTDDVVYRIPGRNQVAGEYRGIEGFAGILRRLRDETSGTIALAPTSVVADNDNLISRARVTAERRGKHLDTENCYAFRFVGGKVADGQVFLSDPAQVDDFFA